MSTVSLVQEQRRVFTVSSVVRRADQVLRERTAQAIWIRGEVSSWSQTRSGHCYFCLKDDGAELQCVLWRERAKQLPALPREGMEIDVLGTLGVYVRKGRFQLDVQRLDLTGQDGLWSLAKDELIGKLRGEGLLDERRKRPLPRFPQRIGLVTSVQGAALQDMWRTMRRRAWWAEVLVSGCAVEGAAAAPEIVRAIRRFGTGAGQTPVDLVIVARGGGSRESLWAFNMEEVARAIAACPFPTISAVGHETDYTVADLVADVRAATPTAGAEYATPDGVELLQRFQGYAPQLRTRMERTVARAADDLDLAEDATRRAIGRRGDVLRTRIAGLEREVHARAPRERYRRLQERFAALEAAIPRLMRRRHRDRSELLQEKGGEVHRAMELRLEYLSLRFAALAGQTDARSPLRALARGYAVVTDAASGALIRSPEQAPAGTPLSIRLRDGVLHATSESAKPSLEVENLPHAR